MRHDAVWPVDLFSGRVAVAYALHVKCFIDVLEEWEPHNAVVCTLVFKQCGAAKLGRTGECAVNTGRVEDLVDTE
jgi:hypothetical protein